MKLVTLHVNKDKHKNTKDSDVEIGQCVWDANHLTL